VGTMAGNKARTLYRHLRDAGVDPRKTVAWLGGQDAYRSNRRKFKAQVSTSLTGQQFAWGTPFPCYGDRQASAGETTGHYFHQDLLVAQEVFHRNPRRHIDVGSSVYGFVSHVAAFRPIEVIDIRPLCSEVPNISFVQADLMEAREISGLSADSVSCLHALEHLGLGRYGDPVNVDGWLYGLRNLSGMTAPGGWLYLSVPISRRPRIEFDAHRVFQPGQITEALAEGMSVKRFAYVDDDGDLHRDVDWLDERMSAGLSLDYGCGIWFARKEPGGQPGIAGTPTQ